MGRENGRPPSPEQRWRSRPVQAALIKLLVVVIPVAAGVAVAATLSRALPRPVGAAVVGWWALLFGASALAISVMEKLARRLLPLAVLMQLTLIFPDRAPSRFALARRAGSVRQLEERVRRAKQHGIEDDPARAAESILTLVAALSAHDRRTRGHSERVRVFTDLVAEAMRLPGHDRDRLRWSALLHDVGKLEVPGRILNKPGKPDPHEWETLKRHPEEGARLAGPLLPWLGEWGLAIHEHHERWDGRGYPKGLAGTEISMGGRILTVCDSFDTMTSARAYKKPLSVVAARKELAACAGAQFDPTVVRSFFDVSLGKLRWRVGPLAWLAQIPFVRWGTAQVAGAARTATAAVAKAVVGLLALGAAGAASVPAYGGESAPPTVAVEETEPTNFRTDGKPPPDRFRPASPDHDEDGSGGDPGGEDQDGEPDGEGDENLIEDTLDDPVGTVEETLSDPVGTVNDLVDDTSNTLTDTVSGTTDTLGDVVDGTTDTLGL